MKGKTASNINWRSSASGIFLLFLILSIFFSYEMGNRNFADPDEGRYVEISREMVATGDYITPRLNGLKYFEKPPLFYWMQAACIKAFGINEISMRLWVVFFAILGCLSVFFIGSRYYSHQIGLLSAGILATNVLYYVHSRLIILDLVVSVLMSGALWCFYIAFVQKNGEKLHKKYWIVAMYALSALACLTKGLIGIVLPVLVAFLWIMLTRNTSKIKEIFYIPGLLVFLIIFSPWHILIAKRNSDFLHFYFVVEHFLRYTTTIHYRYQPLWFFIPILLGGFLPWTGFTLVAMKNAMQKSVSRNSENIFLVCWILGILGFFSCSNSKLIPYILPITQPIALITGITIVESFNAKKEDFKIGVLINIALFVIVSIAYMFAKLDAAYVWETPDASVLINVFFILIWLEVIVWLCAMYSKISIFSAILCCLFLSANIMWTINKAAVFYQEVSKPSTKHFAAIINMNKKDDDLVFCYKRYYQDFPVYLRSVVGVVDFVGELEFGANAEKNNGRLISKDDFWKLWDTTKKRIFLLLSRSHYKEVFTETNISHKILDFDKYFIVITNK